MILLPDVNVWIALTSDRHVHHTLARQWLQTTEQDRLVFCRISEMGFLRLLTNAHVMGNDVLSPLEAWRIYGEWRADGRVLFVPERIGFNEDWQRMGRQVSAGPNAWTDAYLAAFALHVGATIVTFDRRFLPLGSVSIHYLG
ncbi:MAG: TA system VapC family ribonuclease toxin [Acidobacteriota bacterium]